MQNRDLFENKSKNWDMNSIRVVNAKEIADLILDNIQLTKEMIVADLGAGTGLLSYFLAPHVRKIIAIDSSRSMLEELKAKQSDFACDVESYFGDFSTFEIEETLSGVVSSMTIHHIEDIRAMFVKLFNIIQKDGFIALADLDSEDGTFHGDNNEGVFHFGFQRDELARIAKEVGFSDIKFETANIIKKPHREFSVFVMMAKR